MIIVFIILYKYNINEYPCFSNKTLEQIKYVQRELCDI